MRGKASNKRQRIKLLLTMEPLLGGTLRHLKMILRALPTDEFDVHLAVSHQRNPHARDLYESWRRTGFTVHDLPMGRELSPRRDLAALARLVGLCGRERFDIVHTHSAKAGFLGRFAGHVNCAVTIHTPHVPPFARWPDDREYLPLERLAACWTSRFIALSKYQADLLRGYDLAPDRRIIRLPNAVDAAETPNMARDKARRKLGLPREAPVVLGVGRLCEQKGFDVLVETARLLARVGDPGHYAILGDGPEERSLRMQISAAGLEDRFDLPGHVDDVDAWYAACDVVVMPSRWEGMPYVLLEAKAAGRPTVISKVSGMEEFVCNGEDGLLVPSANPQALAHALSGLADRRAELDTMGRCARQGMRPEWKREHFEAAIRDIYRGAAAK